MSAKLQGSIQQLRTRITAAKARVGELENAMVSRDEAQEALDLFIERTAQKAATPQVDYLVTGETIPNRAGAMTHQAVLALLCWLDPNLVRNRLLTKLDAIYGDDAGIDSRKRSEEQQRLKTELFDLEVEEERIVLRAESEGLTIARRGDADPRAILEA